MYRPKSSKTKSRDRWGDWSDWVWSDEQQRYYKWRESQEGTFDYEWAPLSGSSAAAAAAADPVDARTPRGGDLDDITEGVQKLSTDEGLVYSEINQTEDVASYGSSPNQYAYTQSGPPSTRLPKTTSKGSSNKKGKSKAHNDEEDEEENFESSSGYKPKETRDPYRRHAASTQGPYETPSYQPTTQAHTAYNQTYPYGQQPYPTPESDVSSAYSSTAGYPASTAETEPSIMAGSGMPSETEQYPSDPYSSNYSHYGTQNSRVHFVPESPAAASDDEEGINESEAYQRALEESRLYQQHSQGTGESSAAASAPTAYAQNYDPELEQRQTTPTPMGHMPDIRGTGGEAESLDPRYRVEPSTQFQPGEVFKVLWSEPSGTTNVGGTPTISDRKEIRNQYGLSFYVGFRRFIVIANDEGHCTCVPILTYGGKGCKKKGVKPQKHGIIHEKGHKARQLMDEPKLGFSPVRMMIEAEGEKLAKESRANYSKLVTIEHNVKVFFIGHIVPEDWDMVRDAVNRCWEDKIHHKRKAHGRYAKG